MKSETRTGFIQARSFISTASAAAILGRLRAALIPFEPGTLLAMTEDGLRGCGLSIQKIRALRSVAEAVLGGEHEAGLSWLARARETAATIESPRLLREIERRGGRWAGVF